MVNITLDINMDDVIDDVDDFIKKQIPYAAHVAVNETVYKTSIALKKALPFFIEGGPIAFTKRGVQYTKSKSKRHLMASVFIPDAQWKYMRWVIDGGSEKFNRSRHGGAKPIYENTRFNKFGNIPGRVRKEALWRDLLNKNEGPQRSSLGKGQFIGTINGTTGLWKRLGKDGRSKLKLLVIFNKDPVTYRARFPFFKMTNKHVNKLFPRSFNAKLRSIVAREAKTLKVK